MIDSSFIVSLVPRQVLSKMCTHSPPPNLQPAKEKKAAPTGFPPFSKILSLVFLLGILGLNHRSKIPFVPVFHRWFLVAGIDQRRCWALFAPNLGLSGWGWVDRLTLWRGFSRNPQLFVPGPGHIFVWCFKTNRKTPDGMVVVCFKRFFCFFLEREIYNIS